MTKRERVIAAIERKKVDVIPAGFSLHFPAEIASGEKAVAAHLDFLKKTDTDILKIMNENLFPCVDPVKTPADWKNIPSYSLKDPFIQNQLDLTKRILDKCGTDVFTMGTIHGVFASSIHPIKWAYDYHSVRELVCAHIRQNRQPVLDALKRVTEGLCLLARAMIECGLDAVYYAALGGEKHFLTDEEFDAIYEPLDREVLAACRTADAYTFLHICKENLNMDRYASYADDFDVVNWGVCEAPLSLTAGKKLFPGKTIFGGLANHGGALTDGSEAEIAAEVKRVIGEAGREGFILGADCTLPTETPYGRLRAAVEAARS